MDSRARGGEKGRNGQHDFAGLHWNQDGDGDSERGARFEDSAADSTRKIGQARGDRGPHHLPLFRRSGLRHRSQYRHQWWPTYAVMDPRSPGKTSGDAQARKYRNTCRAARGKAVVRRIAAPAASTWLVQILPLELQA